MTKGQDKGLRAIFSLTCKRLEIAEANLTAALQRLSALDAEIAGLCIDRARIVLTTGNEQTLAAVELARRMAALRIEELKRIRTGVESECDTARDETRRLLRQKIGLEEALDAVADDERRRSRHR